MTRGAASWQRIIQKMNAFYGFCVKKAIKAAKKPSK
jgi:hypothetical protein